MKVWHGNYWENISVEEWGDSVQVNCANKMAAKEKGQERGGGEWKDTENKLQPNFGTSKKNKSYICLEYSIT